MLEVVNVVPVQHLKLFAIVDGSLERYDEMINWISFSCHGLSLFEEGNVL